METVHRYDTGIRQEYLLDPQYAFRLKPQPLYIGVLSKQAGWKAKRHSHEYAEVVFVWEGHGTVSLGGREHAIRQGDILVYNAGIEHTETSSVDDPMELRFIGYDKLQITNLPPNCLLPSEYGFLFHTGEMYDGFRLFFELLVQEFEKKEIFYMEMVQHASLTLVVYLYRLVSRTKSTKELLRGNHTMALALEYIDAHYTREISLETLSARCYANKYYLCHLFSRTQGMSIGRYILQKRLDAACARLQETTLPVASIAEQTGFGDSSYFCRAFKKATGLTPLQYRTVHGGQSQKNAES